MISLRVSPAASDVATSAALPPARWERPIVLAFCASACAIGSLFLGQDRNFDQLNYHVYTVHAWLTGRGTLDLAAGQIQTWINPTSYLPAYGLIMWTPPVVAGAVLGALAGANGYALWVISRALVRGTRVEQLVLAALATVIGLTGSMFLSLLGSTFSENLCSALVLAAIAVLVSANGQTSAPPPRRFLLSGVWLGAACGLKFTHLVYAMGLVGAIVVLWPVFRPRLAHAWRFAAGFVAGFAALGGYWSIRLWLEFRNPMFPFFNGIFRSPWHEPVNFADTRFLPSSVAAALVSYPFEWALGVNRTTELAFREPRFAMIAVVVPVAMVAAFVWSRRERGRSEGDASADDRRRSWNVWLCTCFFVLSYVVWAKQFSYQRYVLSLELLTGPILVAWTYVLVRSWRWVTAVSAALTVAAILQTTPQDWRRLPYGENWYGLSVVAPLDATLYVLTGAGPSSYVIPFLPAQNRYVRIDGNMPLEPGRRLGRVAAARIAQFDGPIRTLSTTPLTAAEIVRLRRFGLDVVPASCRTFSSRMNVFRTCVLVRRTPDE